MMTSFNLLPEGSSLWCENVFIQTSLFYHQDNRIVILRTNIFTTNNNQSEIQYFKMLKAQAYYSLQKFLINYWCHHQNMQCFHYVISSNSIYILQQKLKFTMLPENLTNNGIEKMLNRRPAILQIINNKVLGQGKKLEPKYLFLTLSDGFSFVDNTIIDKELKEILFRDIDNINYTILKIKDVHIIKSPKNPHILIKDAEIITKDINSQIGNPILHEQFIKNNKINPNGNNEIPEIMKQSNSLANQNSRKNKEPVINNVAVQKVQQASKVEKKIQKPPKEIKNQEKQRIPSQESIKQEQRQKQQASKVEKKIQKLPKEIKNQEKRRIPSQESNKQEQRQKQNKMVKKAPNKPIQKVENNKQKKQYINKNIISILDLYPGQESWSILVRVLSKSQIKKIQTKKATELEIFKIQLVDKQRTIINGTFFGENATKWQNNIFEDHIYQISGGNILMENYQGKSVKKITFNDFTKINLVDEDQLIPTVQEISISLGELIKKDLGTEWPIICLIKQQSEATTFQSKTGKPLIKKQITICDPQEKVQLTISLWNELSNMNFEKSPYYFSAISITQYKKNKQFSSTYNTVVRPVRNHALKKYKDLSSLEFKKCNPCDQKRQSYITNFSVLLEKANQLSEKDIIIWSQVRCYINSIKTSGTIMYLSCPICKRKVTQLQNSTCTNCNNRYSNAKHRYIIQVQLVDYYSSIWATAFDQVAEKLLKKSADQVKNYQIDKLQSIAKTAKYKEMKFLINSRLDFYENGSRVKHAIQKAEEVNPIIESKQNIKLIRKYLQ